MSHTVTYNSELRIIETKAYGDLDLIEAKKIISEIVKFGLEKNCFLCLTDYREAIMKLSTLEIYDIPKIISSATEPLGIPARQFKRAVVVKRDLEDYQFFETVTSNNGQNAKLFDDVEEAKKWLTEK